MRRISGPARGSVFGIPGVHAAFADAIRSRYGAGMFDVANSATRVGPGISGAGVAGQAFGAITRPIGNVITREFGYWSEEIATNHIPEPQGIVEAYYTKTLEWDDTYKMLCYHGINWKPESGADATSTAKAWKAVLANSAPVFDIGTAKLYWQQHYLTNEEFEWYIRRHGMETPLQRQTLLRNRGFVDVGTATSWWHQGLINEPEYIAYIHGSGIGDDVTVTRMLTQDSIAPLAAYHQWWLSGWVTDEQFSARLDREGLSKPEDKARYLRERPVVPMDMVLSDYHTRQVPVAETIRRMELHGLGRDEERNALLQYQRPFSPAEAVNLWYRRIIGDDTLQDSLEADNIHGRVRQEAWMKGIQPIPGASDLISFAVHEGWDQAVVDRFGYDEEFPPEFAHLMSMQGWNYSQPVPDATGKLTPGVAWSKLYWRNHWMPMTASQAADAFHRLRQDRVARYADRIPGLTAFTWDDFNQALKIQDYAPTVRKFIAATSFSILDIRVVRRLYALGRRNRQWLIDQMRDRGYTLDDANAIADTEDAIIEHSKNAGVRSFERSMQRRAGTAILNGYRIGTYSNEQAKQALVDLGVDMKVAATALEGIAAEENIKTVKDGISRLRAAYLGGEFAPGELRGQLASLGLANEAVTRYVQRWTVQRSQRRKMATTAQILSWVKDGRMSPDTARQRLANLGWIAPDALIAVQSAVHDHELAEGKALAAADRSRLKLVGELEAVAKKLDAAGKKAQADLKRLTPLASLKKWFTGEIVSESYVRQRLAAMGYPSEIVEMYITEWKGDDKAGEDKQDATETPADETVDLATVTNPTKLVGGTAKIAADSQGKKLEGGNAVLGDTQ